MSIGYTWEKLYGAVQALACRDGTLQDRLASAYRAMDMLTPTDFPEDALRDAYVRLVEAWRTGESRRANGTMATSPAVLPPDQARALAEQLLHLYTDVTRVEEQYYRALRPRDL